MNNPLPAIERWLRIDPDDAKSRVMRARAIYLIGGAFVITQVFNMIGMRYSYGALTFDHAISLTACVLVLATIAMMRLHKIFPVYALIFSVLIFGGVMSSAVPGGTGINTALLPFFVMGIITNGFIAGLRSTLLFGIAAVMGVWFLHHVSATNSPPALFDPAAFADRNFQRAMQTSLAVIMITAIASVFAHHMHAAFEQLETDVRDARLSDHDKTLFLTTMSHELTTPLNGIISLADVLSDTRLDQDQKEMVSLIGQSGDTLQAIVRNVLTYSQIEQRRIAVDHAPFDPARTVARAVRPHQLAAHAKGLDFSLTLPAQLPAQLLGDGARIAQIIDALLSNAVKFTQDGSVRVSVMCRESEIPPHLAGSPDALPLAALVVAVRDTGSGIAASQMSRIYDRFTQGDGSITRAHGGTGLGLTVAQGLSEAMGAQLAAQSREGAGSIFTLSLSLPIAAATEPPAEIARAA